nr:hypothetical protein [Tanacetum cinerariifolium]
MYLASSYHISRNQDWFVAYKEFDGGHVFTGNDSPCKVVGIRKIRITMHDGVVRTLTNVCHVPDLKKLISLGVLYSKGFKYMSENGVLHVLKGALVAMKATKEKSNSDLTMLWHMRLGHMSEKCMVGNGYSRNRQKPSEKRQNQTQSGKDRKRQSHSKPKVKSQSPRSTKVNPEKVKVNPENVKVNLDKAVA